MASFVSQHRENIYAAAMGIAACLGGDPTASVGVPLLWLGNRVVVEPQNTDLPRPVVRVMRVANTVAMGFLAAVSGGSRELKGIVIPICLMVVTLNVFLLTWVVVRSVMTETPHQSKKNST